MGYPSDLTDAQWALVEPPPPPSRTGPRGEHQSGHIGVGFFLRGADRLRMAAALPHYFPPWRTVYWYLVRWHDEGTVARVLTLSSGRLRKKAGSWLVGH
ncbi:transposase [Streptomyces hirsutus]|uniref:transposase n=1 Tax=Streptomyces hirsutus TaxID=35620 RepID=UPI003644D316